MAIRRRPWQNGDEAEWQRPLECRLKALCVAGAAAGLLSYRLTRDVDLAALRGMALPAMAMVEMGVKAIRTRFLPARGGALHGVSAVVGGILSVLLTGSLVIFGLLSWRSEL